MDRHLPLGCKQRSNGGLDIHGQSKGQMMKTSTNSRKSFPVSPLRKNIEFYTLTSVAMLLILNSLEVQ